MFLLSIMQVVKMTYILYKQAMQLGTNDLILYAVPSSIRQEQPLSWACWEMMRMKHLAWLIGRIV